MASHSSKTIAIIQARLGSTRLPGKVLERIGDQTVLDLVIERLSRAAAIDEIIVATTMNRHDLPIVETVSHRGIRVYCGSEDDVLDRYWHAARLSGADTIVRVTADCPLIDPEVVDHVATRYRETGADYASNTIQPTYPDGLDVEFVRTQALYHAWSHATLKSEREHVTPFIKKNPDTFHLQNVEHAEDRSHLRWTIDEPQDLAFLTSLAAHFGGSLRDARMDDICAVLSHHPELAEFNAAIGRDEGYAKSVAADRADQGDT